MSRRERLYDKVVYRGIMERAQPHARRSIARQVIEGVLLIGIVVGITIVLALLLAAGREGAGAIGVVSVMGWMAMVSDPATTYAMSWLLDDPELF